MNRASRQRDVVLAAVRSTMEHPTAEWVHREARRRMPRISLATVYRNLKQLAELGLIRELHSGGESVRFDGNTGRHYHIRCVGCGRINDLPMSVDARLERLAGEATNYEIVGHALEVHGVCPACRKQGPDRNHSHHGLGAAPAARRSRPSQGGSKPS